MEPPPTNASLLAAIQSQTPAKREAAWARFARLYRPDILRWCQRWKLNDQTAEDLTQEILMKLSARFAEKCYDPARGRFHSWLSNLVHHALIDFMRKQGLHEVIKLVPGDDPVLVQQASLAEAEQLSNALTNHPDKRAALAVARVEAEVKSRDWQVTLRYYAERRPVAEIAAELELSVCNVRKIIQRVKNKLDDVLHELEQERSGD